MRAISQARWNALAAFCRKPMAAAVSQEIAWFGTEDDRVIATLIVESGRRAANPWGLAGRMDASQGA
jgi:hypothetical protein